MATAEISTAALETVQRLYDRGLYRQAHEAGCSMGPLRRWPGTDGQILAGRLAGNLGARRAGCAIHLRAWRADRMHPDACLYYVLTVGYRFGPLRALRAHQQIGSLADAPPETRADWYAVRGHLASSLRDFDAAERWIGLALRFCDSQPWPWVERSAIWEAQDRYADALEAAQHALGLQAWYRPAVQAAANLLQQVNRDKEALALLENATEHLESGDVWAQLAILQKELGLYRAAKESWHRADELLPLKDREYQKFIIGRHCDAAYDCGDLDECARCAEKSEEPFYRALAKRLASGEGAAKAVQLPVGFVRQHYMTCVPATLATLCNFWQVPAEHLEIAEKICYDGTSSHSERRWAEQNGFVAREFKVTWPVAEALLDRGVPFTLATVETTNAHMQAVIGYDARRGTLQVRDPTFRAKNEFIADGLVERHAATGPRGMALVPRAKAHLLEGVDLPESDLYDRLFRLETALQAHQRDVAAEGYRELLAVAPGHRISILARRALAAYDSNLQELLAATEEQTKLFPRDAGAQLARLSILTQLSRRDDRLQLLHQICEAPGGDPAVWLHYVREYIDDARRHADLRWRLRKLIRLRPHLAAAYHDLARIEWTQERRDAGHELFRIAACLDDKDEGLSMSYFSAARHAGRTAEAVAMLRGRLERFGKRSSWPARTLCRALTELGQAHDAKQILDEALAQRPDDGELLLYAADFLARIGEFEAAAQLLARAQPCSHRTAWRRTAADIALYRGEKTAACQEYQAIVEDEPTSPDAQRTYARLLADTLGVPCALDHLRDVVARFPHHFPLNQLHAEWLRQHDPAEHERALRQMLNVFATDAWTRRELALAYTRNRDFPAALCEAEIARDLEPGFSWSWSVLGSVHVRQGAIDRAREELERAIALAVDNRAAIGELWGLAHTAAERFEVILFVYEELCRQVIFGDGLLAWRDMAIGILEPVTMLHVLQEALQARPDLWQAWAAVVRQLTSMAQIDAALRFARRAAEKFPLLTPIWMELAQVQRRRFDLDGEREALNQALAIDPCAGAAVRQLADSYEREQDHDRSRQLLEKLLSHSPLEAENHGWLAAVLWQMGRKEDAVERLKIAVKLHSGYEWGWTTLAQWARELGQPTLARELAENLTRQRPGEARCWHMLAIVSATAGDFDAARRAVTKVIELDPRSTDAFDLQARLLVQQQRFDEALAACQPPALGNSPAFELRGRAAWVQAKRGKYAAAIEAMERVLQDAPGYCWGLSELAEWYAHEKRWDDYLRLSERLVAAAPSQAISYGHRGAARMQAGDRQGAKNDWQLALRLEPAYAYAALALADAQLEDRQFDDAAGTIASIRRQAPSDFILAREMRLACALGDRQRGEEVLAELCRWKNGNQWPIRAAADEMAKRFGQKAALAVLQKSFSASDANPEAAALLIEGFARSGKFAKCRRVLRKVRHAPEAWCRGAVAYLGLAAEKNRRLLVYWFVRQNSAALRAQTWTWGSVAGALSKVALRRHVVRWCDDWRQRQEMTPNMLFYYTLNLRYRFRFDLAAEVHRFALTLPADGAEHVHRLMLLIDDFAAPMRPQDAEARLAEIDPERLADFYRDVWQLAKGWIKVMSPPELATLGYFAAADRLKFCLGNSCGSFLRIRPFRLTWNKLMTQLASSRGRPLLSCWHNFLAACTRWI